MRHSKYIQTLAAIALGALLLAPSALRADDAKAESGPVTYTGQVAKILNQRCVVCHRPGQIAPMSFMSYKDVRPWAKAIDKSVKAGEMPPWFAADTGQHFANDTRLAQEEIDILTRWVAQGAQLGDPYDLPPAPKFRDDIWKIGTPDAVFGMTTAFTMGDNVEDTYENFTIPTGLKEDKWVTHIELRPGNFAIVHHILAFVVPPGGGKQGGALAKAGLGGDLLGAALSGGGLLSKYAPGNNPDVFMPGTGKLIKAGSTIMFQMHYHKEAGAGTAQSDKSSVALKFADAPLKDPITTAWIVNPMLSIPPSDPDYSSAAGFTFSDDGHIQALFPHMHYRGKAFKFEAIYPDKTKEVLLDVPAYDFDWQLTYVFKEPKPIPKGTKIVATGVFDNSADNAYNPDPSITVTWGEATTDEMMLGLMDYTYVTDKENQGMIGLPDAIMSMVPPELRNINPNNMAALETHMKSLEERFTKGAGGLQNLQKIQGGAKRPPAAK